MTTKQQVDDFLALKRIAVVASLATRRASDRAVAGVPPARYDAVPVNPLAKEIDGSRASRGLRTSSPASTAF